MNQEVKVIKWDGTHPKEDEINKVIDSKNDKGMMLVDTDYQFQFSETQTVPVHVLVLYFEETEDRASLSEEFDFDNITTEELEKELE